MCTLRLTTRAWIALAIVVVAACSSRPTAAPTPSQPPVDYGAPPLGVPLFYVGDQNHPGWYVGLDWTGKPRGTIKLAQPIQDVQSFIQAPDGSGFVIPPFKGLAGEYLDRLARPEGPAPAAVRIAWADDSRHLCTLDGSLGQWRLAVVAPDGTSAAPKTLALNSSNLDSGIIAIDFVACSVRSDKAVLANTYAGRPSELWVVQLSTGEIRLHKNDGEGVSTIAASPDASLIAENSSKSSGYLLGTPASYTVIRKSTDGSVVRQLAPTIGVLGFSADDSVALVSKTPWAAGVASNVAVVDVATGVESWSAGGEELTSFRIQPDGNGFALFFKSVGDQTSHAAINVYLVGTGQNGYLPNRYVQP